MIRLILHLCNQHHYLSSYHQALCFDRNNIYIYSLSPFSWNCGYFTPLRYVSQIMIILKYLLHLYIIIIFPLLLFNVLTERTKRNKEIQSSGSRLFVHCNIRVCRILRKLCIAGFNLYIDLRILPYFFSGTSR
jgi:hypothetical protein